MLVSGLMAESCLGHVWLFESLELAELLAMVEAAMKKVYAPGEAIFVQADPTDRMFLIKAGRVKLSKLQEDGTEFTLDIRKAGDFLGENMLGEETAYPVTASCMEETLICGFTKEKFEGLVLDHPRIGLQVMRNLSKRILSLANRIESMSLTRLGERLYQVLRNIALEHGVKSRDGLMIQFPLTHEDLAFLVGAHRVSVTKALKELKRTGSIVQQKRRLVVRDR
ncbi:MAG: Global nitrogen regulator [Syntrophorhabdaceae bacterium PtaU1.Bin034]|nr:MAG: Global nitrogen regulator [Syntrophorhabdaceae bacterium PtaU1.Bin034]